LSASLKGTLYNRHGLGKSGAGGGGACVEWGEKREQKLGGELWEGREKLDLRGYCF